eukprot:SM000082S22896  [mRNA]  locus=s82:520031:522109:- [translate_table: standard]
MGSASLPGDVALAAFCREQPSSRVMTADLNSILEVIAATGKYWYVRLIRRGIAASLLHDWSQLRKLLAFRLDQLLQEYNRQCTSVEVGPPPPLFTGESFDELEQRLQNGGQITPNTLFSAVDLAHAHGACLLDVSPVKVLLHPHDTYRTLDKFALAIEKLLMVTSSATICTSPYPSLPLPEPPIPQEGLDGFPSPKAMDVSQNESVNTTGLAPFRNPQHDNTLEAVAMQLDRRQNNMPPLSVIETGNASSSIPVPVEPANADPFGASDIGSSRQLGERKPPPPGASSTTAIGLPRPDHEIHTEAAGPHCMAAATESTTNKHADVSSSNSPTSAAKIDCAAVPASQEASGCEVETERPHVDGPMDADTTPTSPEEAGDCLAGGQHSPADLLPRAGETNADSLEESRKRIRDDSTLDVVAGAQVQQPGTAQS